MKQINFDQENNKITIEFKQWDDLWMIWSVLKRVVRKEDLTPFYDDKCLNQLVNMWEQQYFDH